MTKSYTVDEADRSIIDLLCENGRLSNRELASHVGLTEVTVASRLRRLQDAGIFRVNAVIDSVAAGYAFGLTFMINVEGEDPLETAKLVALEDQMHMVALTFGSMDVVAFALASDYADIDRLTRNIKAVKGVAALSVEFQYESLKSSHRYSLVGNQDHPLLLPNPVVPLDQLDDQILQVLVRDGHVSNRTLARRFETSEGTIRSRIRRLEEADMLRIRGQVDPLLSGEMGALCMVAVTLDGRDDDTAIGQLNALPAVLSSVRTTGESQLMMTAGAANTAAMVQTILQVVRRVPGVVTTETWQVIRYVKMIRHFTRIH